MPARLTDMNFLGGNRTMDTGWTSPYLTHHPVFTDAADATTAMRDGSAALVGLAAGTEASTARSRLSGRRLIDDPLVGESPLDSVERELSLLRLPVLGGD